MSVQQASKLMVGLFSQSTTGKEYSQLSDASYKKLKWSSESIIPIDYDFTNINRAGTTVETVERAFITDLSKVTKYASGKVTPGNITFASVLKADTESIISKLRALTVEDPYLCLLMVGVYKSGDVDTSVIYDVFYATAGILTEDGSATAEAGANFTGNLAFQPSGVPVETIENAKASLTWTPTGVSFTATSSS